MSAFSPQWQGHLSHLGLIKITGEDTLKYIQGQVTCNVEMLTGNNWQFGAHCDFKGKMWNMFQAFKWHDAVYLLCQQSALAGALAELKIYGVFSKVEITDATAQMSIVGCAGNAAILDELAIELPEISPAYSATLVPDSASSTTTPNSYVLHIATHLPAPNALRHLIITDKTVLTTMLPDGATIWNALDIQAGIGAISDTTSNEFVPQMLNLQAIDAIDFKKGCYMGQEVVARTKYLGKNKRAGYILTTTGDIDIAAGETLEIQVGENWRRGGIVLNSGYIDGQTWFFAVLPNDTERGSHLRVKTQPDIIATTQALPYTLDV